MVLGKKLKIEYPQNEGSEMPRRISICCEMREDEEKDTFIYEFTLALYFAT